MVIRTTEGKQHRRFATDLFNRWGLGDRARDDGLLVFAALQDRRAEIILGDGIDGPRHVTASQQIMDSVVVPAFRANDPNGAMLKGAVACDRRILDANLDPPNRSAEVTTADDWDFEIDEPAPVAHTPNVFDGPEPRGNSGLKWFLLGGGVAGGGGGWFGVRRYFRYRTRTCPDCQIPMSRLSETADNAHLSESQRVEEKLRSVDYDVWSCPSCSNVQTFRYGALFTSYSKCPDCRAEDEA